MSKSLKILNDEELKYIRLIYTKEMPHASHVVSLIDNYFFVKLKQPDKTFLEFFALESDWKIMGTFLMKFRNFDLFTYTLDESGNSIYELLTKANALNIQRRTVCYGIRNEHLRPLYTALKEQKVPVKKAVECWFYWLPKEKALNYNIDCPEDVYLMKLDKSHAGLVANLWPYSFPDAKDYISLILEMNVGYGVFLNNGDKLVSWILKNSWGTLAILETLPEYQRKGYGTLVTKRLCTEIAKEGINPACTIVTGNIASETMFKKLGFQYNGNCTFVIL